MNMTRRDALYLFLKKGKCSLIRWQLANPIHDRGVRSVTAECARGLHNSKCTLFSVAKIIFGGQSLAAKNKLALESDM